MVTIPVQNIMSEKSAKKSPALLQATAIRFITRNTSMIELSLVSFSLVITRDSE